MIPAAIASSRATTTRRPALLGPSPETSMTRRLLSYAFSSNNGSENSMAPLMDV